MYRILLVEDDPGIAQAVCAHLRQWELDARCVQNFHTVMEEFTAFDPQLVLLDISLPFFNGYHWCTQIRAVSQVPVVFLSSASENMNIVMAMNMGADDFIAKPFDRNVLMAKVQALLRRTDMRVHPLPGNTLRSEIVLIYLPGQPLCEAAMRFKESLLLKLGNWDDKAGDAKGTPAIQETVGTKETFLS